MLVFKKGIGKLDILATRFLSYICILGCSSLGNTEIGFLNPKTVLDHYTKQINLRSLRSMMVH